MLYLMFFVSLGGGTILSFVKANKLYRFLFEGFCFLFMWVFLGWAKGAYDIEIGIARYINYQQYSSFTEFGFNSLVNLGHFLGWNYRTFYVFWSFVELFVIFKFVHEFSAKPIIVMTLFMIFPMIMVFQYTRNNIAFVFSLLAFIQLIKKKKFYLLKYCIFILIASSIHLSSVFFLLYLPFMTIQNRKSFIVVILIIFFLLFFSRSSPFLFEILNRVLGSEKVKIVSGTTHYDGMVGRVLAVMVSLAEFWFLFCYFRKVFNHKMESRFDQFVIVMNTCSFLFVPLTLNFGAGFARILLLLTIINYCFIVNHATLISPKMRPNVYVFAIFCMLTLFVANFRSSEMQKLVLIPFFEQNEIFQLR